MPKNLSFGLYKNGTVLHQKIEFKCPSQSFLDDLFESLKATGLHIH